MSALQGCKCDICERTSEDDTPHNWVRLKLHLMVKDVCVSCIAAIAVEEERLHGNPQGQSRDDLSDWRKRWQGRQACTESVQQ